MSYFYGNVFVNIAIRDALFILNTREDQFFYVLISTFSFSVFMDKSSTFPLVRRILAHGHDGRKNDVVFCGSEAQQHVVFFPGDVQVRNATWMIIKWTNWLSSYSAVVCAKWLSRFAVFCVCMLSWWSVSR